MKVYIDIEEIRVSDGSGICEYRAWYGIFESDILETEWEAIQDLCKQISQHENDTGKAIDPYGNIAWEVE